jgi:hypothetical protein
VPEIDTYSLRNFKVGGQEFGITKSTKTLHIAGDDWSVEKWHDLVDRVHIALTRDGLVNGVSSKGKLARDPSFGMSTFLSNNVGQIHRQKRGFLKRAPIWLRWLYESVVTKEDYRNG